MGLSVLVCQLVVVGAQFNGRAFICFHDHWTSSAILFSFWYLSWAVSVAPVALAAEGGFLGVCLGVTGSDIVDSAGCVHAVRTGFPNGLEPVVLLSLSDVGVASFCWLRLLFFLSVCVAVPCRSWSGLRIPFPGRSGVLCRIRSAGPVLGVFAGDCRRMLLS